MERVATAGTNTTWVIDGYSLSTHPDLCERLRDINERAEYRYEFGRPVLVAPNGLIVAFAGGTHIMCVRVPCEVVDARLVVEGRPDLGPPWTRVDPWTVGVPRAEGLAALAALVRRAVENAADGDPAPRS